MLVDGTDGRTRRDSAADATTRPLVALPLGQRGRPRAVRRLWDVHRVRQRQLLGEALHLAVLLPVLHEQLRRRRLSALRRLGAQSVARAADPVVSDVAARHLLLLPEVVLPQ